MVKCQSWRGPLSLIQCLLLVVVSPTYPALTHLCCWVLTVLLCPRTTFVYPSLLLQTLPPYTLGLSLHSVRHPLILGSCLHVQTDSCLSGSIQTVPCLNPFTHIHTQIFIKKNSLWSCASYFARPLVREWFRHCQSWNLYCSLSVRKQLYISGQIIHQVRSCHPLPPVPQTSLFVTCLTDFTSCHPLRRPHISLVTHPAYLILLHIRRDVQMNVPSPAF